MTNSTENTKLSPVNFTEEERRSSILLNVADLARSGGLLIGAGFFSIILLMGMSITTHFSTLSGFFTTMGFALLLSTLVSILTYNLSLKTFKFKKEILALTSNSVLPESTLAQMQNLLEILITIQKEIQKKEEETSRHNRETKN